MPRLHKIYQNQTQANGSNNEEYIENSPAKWEKQIWSDNLFRSVEMENEKTIALTPIQEGNSLVTEDDGWRVDQTPP